MNNLQIERELKQLKARVNQMEVEDPFLSAKQLAKLLNISLTKAYDLFANPQFPGRKIGGCLRVRRSQVYKYYESLPKSA